MLRVRELLLGIVVGSICTLTVVTLTSQPEAHAQSQRGASAASVRGTVGCPGDCDGDLDVDIDDLNAVLGNWGNICSCPPGTFDCGSGCIDILNDPNNCGGCGLVCPPGFTCVNGICVLQCPPGFVDCNGTCTDILNDPSNCGGCGVVCPPGFVCVNGTCVFQCPPGTIDCGSGCIDILSDPNNCGGCGIVCPPGLVCQNGTCVTP